MQLGGGQIWGAHVKMGTFYYWEFQLRRCEVVAC